MPGDGAGGGGRGCEAYVKTTAQRHVEHTLIPRAKKHLSLGSILHEHMKMTTHFLVICF